MPYQAGQAFIAVSPSLKGFHRKIRQDLAKEMRALDVKIPVKPDADWQPVKQQAKKQGAETGGEFAQAFRRRVDGALKALPDIEVGADTTQAETQIASLRQHLQRLRDQRIGVDIDAAEAEREIAAIGAELQRLSTEDARIDVQANTAAAAAKLGFVEQQADRLDGRDVDIDVKADTANAQRAIFATSASVSALAFAGASFGPALIPALGAATVAVAGLGSALAAAGAGVAAFGLAAAPSINEVSEAMKLQNRAQEELAATGEVSAATSERLGAALRGLSPLQRSLMTGWMGLRDAFNQWAEALEPAVIPVFLQGMRLVEKLLPVLTPIVDSAAGAFSNLLDRASAAMESPHWQRFFDFLGRTAGPAITTFGLILGNLATGFSGILMAFEPMARGIGDGLVGLSERFAAWGSQLSENKDFKSFIAWVQEMWPKVKGVLDALWGAIKNIVQALEPLAGPSLQALQAALDMIATMDPGIIAAITGAVLGWALAQSALNLAMRANPIILIISLIAALIVWVIHAYQESETFRKVVSWAWEDAKNRISKAWNFLKKWVIDPLVAAFKWVKRTAEDITWAVQYRWNQMKERLAVIWSVIKKRAIDPIVNGFNRIKKRAVEIKDGVANAFGTMRDTVASIFGSLVSKILGPIRTVIKWINKHMIGNLNKVTGIFGLTIPDIPVPGGGSGGKSGGGGGGGPRRSVDLNTGGLIPGGGPDQDSVWLHGTPGEGVINRRRMRGIAREMGTTPAGAIAAINQGATPGGGQINPQARGGAFDFIGDIASGISSGIRAIGSSVSGWLKQGAAFALKNIMSPVISGVAHVVPGPEFVQKAMKGILEEAKDYIVKWGEGKDEASEGSAPGRTGRGLPGGVPDLAGGAWAFPLPRGSYRVGGGIGSYPGHTGQDFPAPAGTPVFAPFAGRLSQVSMFGSYGTHSNVYAGPYRVISAHLSSHVGPSRFVSKGEMIGRVGSTGNSTGDHLHEEVRRGGAVQNPRNYWAYDNGGYLPRGLTLAFNNTGQRERILNPAETFAYERGMGSKLEVNTYGTPEGLLNELMLKLRVQQRAHRPLINH